MKIQQLSIFVENREGRLAQITEVLAAAQIDIRAISVADTSDFGILRLIVNDPGQAVKALKAAGMTVSLTDAWRIFQGHAYFGGSPYHGGVYVCFHQPG